MFPIFMLETILALTAVDYVHLARTIQVEAARQYEGFLKWRPVASTIMVNKLSSSEGTKNLMKAYSVIGDRTDFKGQSMLPYRVASQDPMCHTRGNFYHFHWQS